MQNTNTTLFMAMQEGKVGAGEQIIARRRNRRLVPEGVPLNSRLSGALSGNLDANIGAHFFCDAGPLGDAQHLLFPCFAEEVQTAPICSPTWSKFQDCISYLPIYQFIFGRLVL